MEYLCNDDYLDDEDRDIMYSTRAQSSDSEDDSIIALTKLMTKSKDTDQDDDFEKEMDAELADTMEELGNSFLKFTEDKKSSPNDKQKKVENEYYDNIYFDTDESSDEDKTDNDKKCKRKRKILTNDELLYDPLLDEKDEDWVEENRKKKIFGTSKGAADSETEKLPLSDAVLNCPACFTTLSFDCQRHEVYKDQYRAMFVSNCYIKFKEELLCPLKDDKKDKSRKRKRKTDEETTTSKLDVFHPVLCEECNTKVGVYDNDEVYHFFNVLPSY